LLDHTAVLGLSSDKFYCEKTKQNKTKKLFFKPRNKIEIFFPVRTALNHYYLFES